MNKPTYAVMGALGAFGLTWVAHLIFDRPLPALTDGSVPSVLSPAETASRPPDPSAALRAATPPTAGLTEAHLAGGSPDASVLPSAGQTTPTVSIPGPVLARTAPPVVASSLIFPSGLTLHLAPGVRQPIVFSEVSGEPSAELTPAQLGAMLDAAEAFAQRIDAASETEPDEVLTEVWETEQAQADASYRILFGDAAYNQQSMEAALRALGRSPAPAARRP